LLLQPWSSDLAIDEVKLQLHAFWIQVHKLLLQYMTTQNAIKIGKGIGKIMELDNKTPLGLFVANPYVSKLRQNTYLPLASGFYMPCAREEPRWVAFKYERLDDYYTLCGLIGHKRVCPAPQKLIHPKALVSTIKAWRAV
jgi:hypothetical protein